ncbi:DUF6923 family protein [Saccharopolyspora sp. 5N708]|uniref:DUF6923 family protein n=1 Tax=Saccharopolyspora sp. 5N708 TaxID=3457424 RepID=UPI003FD08B04
MLVLVASAAWVVAAQAVPTCTALQVRNTGPASTSALYRVVLPAAESTALGELDYRLNALGYAGSQGLVYGIAERGRSGPFPDGGHVVTFDLTGRARDLGPVRAGRPDTPWHPLTAPAAGAIVGNRWYVAEKGYLYEVDIDAASRGYLSVVSMVQLHPGHGRSSFADFDVDPIDGELYGVSSIHQTAAVVRIDRRSGRVEKLVDVPGLPPSGYGSVVIGPDRALYVTANKSGELYRVGRDGSAAKLATFARMSSSDAAGCLRQTIPPSPPTSTAPPPPTTTAPTTTLTPPPLTSSPTPPTTTSPSPTTSIAPPTTRPPEHDDYIPPTQEPGSEDSGHDTEDKRRWALAALLLVIGGSAAVRALRH